jgi:hypothetical protein
MVAVSAVGGRFNEQGNTTYQRWLFERRVQAPHADGHSYVSFFIESVVLDVTLPVVW